MKMANVNIFLRLAGERELDRLLRELLLLDETDFRCRAFLSDAFAGDFLRLSEADELDRLRDLRFFLSTDLTKIQTNELNRSNRVFAHIVLLP